jgi:hypothetical protein
LRDRIVFRQLAADSHLACAVHQNRAKILQCPFVIARDTPVTTLRLALPTG